MLVLDLPHLTFDARIQCGPDAVQVGRRLTKIVLPVERTEEGNSVLGLRPILLAHLTRANAMTTRQLVDPDLLPLVDALPPLQLSEETLPSLRQMITSSVENQKLPDLPVNCTDVFIPSLYGSHLIRGLCIQPQNLSPGSAAILHFHGGGHVMGMPEMNLPQLMEWAARLECLVLSIDYRLAPETPYPGPMEDAYSALHWIHTNSGALNLDSCRIAVAGQSAGGAMAACLSFMARDRNEYPIAFQLLEAPRLEAAIAKGREANPYTGEFVWTRDASEFCRKAYLGEESGSQYASAGLALDLSNLPATFIAVGSLDLFLDECLAYCARLFRTGNSAELIVYPGCFHGFQMAKSARVTKRSHDDSLRALKRALKE